MIIVREKSQNLFVLHFFYDGLRFNFSKLKIQHVHLCLTRDFLQSESNGVYVSYIRRHKFHNLLDEIFFSKVVSLIYDTNDFLFS